MFYSPFYIYVGIGFGLVFFLVQIQASTRFLLVDLGILVCRCYGIFFMQLDCVNQTPFQLFPV